MNAWTDGRSLEPFKISLPSCSYLLLTAAEQRRRRFSMRLLLVLNATREHNRSILMVTVERSGRSNFPRKMAEALSRLEQLLSSLLLRELLKRLCRTCKHHSTA